MIGAQQNLGEAKLRQKLFDLAEQLGIAPIKERGQKFQQPFFPHNEHLLKLTPNKAALIIVLDRNRLLNDAMSQRWGRLTTV
jgi:hypothetical protein